MQKIAIVVGSLRKESFNMALARAVAKLGSDLFTFSFLSLDDIPPYNQDTEMNAPAPVITFKEGIAAADAILFVTPEYNRGIPGVLKNALDWASRPYGKNVWAGKPALLMGVSPGAVGTAVAQSHLRSILTFLQMPLIPQAEVYISFKPEVFPKDGSIANESTKSFLRGVLENAAAWLSKNAGK